LPAGPGQVAVAAKGVRLLVTSPASLTAAPGTDAIIYSGKPPQVTSSGHRQRSCDTRMSGGGLTVPGACSTRNLMAARGEPIAAAAAVS
jgi:hypothetical protein